MAHFDGSAAYDLSEFDESRPRLKAVKSQQKVKEAKARQLTTQRRVNLAFAAAGVIVALVIVGLLIVSRVQLTELNDQIAKQQEQLGILQSETIRLNNEVASKTSAESVDAYAKANGMQKAESYQIEYITVDGGDKIEGEQQEQTTGVWESIAAAIGSWFQ